MSRRVCEQACCCDAPPKATRSRGSPLRRSAKGGTKQGFTLLELLIVVIIIGILAAIGVPQYVRTTERGRVAEASQVLATLRGSETRWRAADPNNGYTTTLTLLDIQAPTLNAWNAPTAATAPNPNVCASRAGGQNDAAVLMINIDSGRTCASTTGAASDWGVIDVGGACGNC